MKIRCGVHCLLWTETFTLRTPCKCCSSVWEAGSETGWWGCLCFPAQRHSEHEECINASSKTWAGSENHSSGSSVSENPPAKPTGSWEQSITLLFSLAGSFGNLKLQRIAGCCVSRAVQSLPPFSFRNFHYSKIPNCGSFVQLAVVQLTIGNKVPTEFYAWCKQGKWDTIQK